ncbi:MAG TPA: TMEM175 family protein [Gaiellaceae bacterium]|nr:TMEM175 family protein [Gaiellaceae bacterium]
MGNRWGTGRIEAFSDGVFAIAITLLVLDVAVPASALGAPWYAIAHQWPSYLAYVTSFVTIGGLWMVHHGIFRGLQYANGTIMRLNLLLLMAVSFLPFPTGLMAEAIRDTSAERAAVVFYGATLLSISILLRILWGAIVSRPDLLNPEVSVQEIKASRRASTPNIGFYAAVIVLALLFPQAAVFGYLAIAIAAVWRARGEESPRPQPAPHP